MQLVRGRRRPRRPSGSGPARSASPWLAPIERTIVQLTKAAAPTAAADVAARVAELRQRLLARTATVAAAARAARRGPVASGAQGPNRRR